ncbi:MAG TPA: hypothetical protein VK638_57020, partial [Edaphobacter sp.]|nr:hypothetical protein [Edaphobacter sp.]
ETNRSFQLLFSVYPIGNRRYRPGCASIPIIGTMHSGENDSFPFLRYVATRVIFQSAGTIQPEYASRRHAGRMARIGRNVSCR